MKFLASILFVIGMITFAHGQSMKDQYGAQKFYNGVEMEFGKMNMNYKTYKTKATEYSHSLVMLGYKDVPVYDGSAENNIALLNYVVDRDEFGNILPPSEDRLLTVYGDQNDKVNVTVDIAQNEPQEEVYYSTNEIPTVTPLTDTAHPHSDTSCYTYGDTFMPVSSVPEIRETIPYDEFLTDPLYERYGMCNCAFKTLEELNDMHAWMVYSLEKVDNEYDIELLQTCKNKIENAREKLNKSMDKFLNNKSRAV